MKEKVVFKDMKDLYCLRWLIPVLRLSVHQLLLRTMMAIVEIGGKKINDGQTKMRPQSMKTLTNGLGANYLAVVHVIIMTND